MHITNWSASRSGPALTIRGKDESDGASVKLANIGMIETRGRVVVAVERDGGQEHILRVG
jgi:hypothetical protein